MPDAPASFSAPLPPIAVTAEAYHLPQHSRSGAESFTYLVRIENGDDQSWKLLRRFWRIVDGRGECTEVEGEGVVGQQPLLTPGALFVYDSFVTVASAPAQMSGHYLLENAWGEQCCVPIPEFQLLTGQLRVLN